LEISILDIILVIKLMFTHDYRNRFDGNLTTKNVLMTQIRAEQKIYSSKTTQPISSHREDTRRSGKRVYHDILYRPSLSPSARHDK
jgi:hypothetical protein